MIKLLIEYYKYNVDQLVYHGSSMHKHQEDFATQTIPCFFSPYKEYSQSFGPIVGTYKLNIEKPFILDNEKAVDIYNNEFIPFADKKGWSHNWTDNLRHVQVGDSISFVVADYLYPFLRRMKRQNIYDYDGIICSEGNSKYDLSFIPLDKSQIIEVDI